jgi:hypothetical protein
MEQSLSSLELPSQPRARDRPLTAGGRKRHAECFRGFRHAEARKVAKLDQSHLLRIQSAKTGERVIEGEEIDWIERRFFRPGRPMSLVLTVDGAKCDLRWRPAAFVSVAPARMVHEDASHDLRGDGKELRPTVPPHVVLRIEA